MHSTTMLWRRRRVADRQPVQTQLLMLPDLCKRQSVEHIVQVKSCIAQLGEASYSEVKMLLTLFASFQEVAQPLSDRSQHCGALIKNYFENDNDIAATQLGCCNERSSWAHWRLGYHSCGNSARKDIFGWLDAESMGLHVFMTQLTEMSNCLAL